MPSIAVVILNWNGLRFLKHFLPSVVANSQEAEIYIIDNNSTDDSILFINTNYPEITTIKNNQNLGYCGGYNTGLKSIKADYYVLLNNDIEVTQDWLLPILEMEKNPIISISQPKILDFNTKNKFEYAGAAGGFLDNLGYPFCNGRVFETLEIDNQQYNKPIKIAWATGACMFIKSEVFWELNGFDEDFFAHMEEIDLCWRAQHLGFEVWYFPQSKVYHVGGGTLHKSNPKKTFLNFRNGLYLLHKNLPQRYFLFIIFLRLCTDGAAGLIFLLKGNFQDFMSIVKAHFAYYYKIFTLQKKRKYYANKVSVLSEKNIVWDYYLKRKKVK